VTTGFDAGVRGSALIAVALAFGGGNIAFAHDTHETCFSGYELSPGVDAGNGLTEGVTFAGIDNLPDHDDGPDLVACDHWAPNSNGGIWTAKIDRVGVAGIGGNGVSVVGGRWFWFDGDDHFHFGGVPGGFVQWPGSLDEDIGCGPDVAQFNITLSVLGHFSAGSFVGCLDDTHLDPRVQPFVFPPRIWGTVNLN
jgi:hypothetical protein